jgi:hypothetical protein
MRTSREWIDRTVAELDSSAGWSSTAPAEGADKAKTYPPEQLTLELTLSPQERQALHEICRDDELSPKQALTHIVRARLLARPQFGRSDRGRLRACLELLRALEQQIGRATRPVKASGQTEAAVNALTRELHDLAAHLRRVCRAIGESMTGNLQFWQADPASPVTAADQAPCHHTAAPQPGAPGSRGRPESRGRNDGPPAPAPRTDSTGG